MNPQMMALAASLFIVLNLILILSGIRFYDGLQKEKYSFLNCFPFELLQKSKFKLIVFVFAALSASSSIFFFQTSFFIISQPLTLLIVLLSFLEMVAWIFVLISTTEKVSLHILSTSIFMVLSIMLSTLITYYLAITPFEAFNKFLPYVTGAISIIQICLLLNPKISSWAKLDKKEENGVLIFIRPKFFVLAFSEWVFYFLNILLLLAILLAVMI